MARIEIPERFLQHLGPEMKMDVHWVDVRLEDGRSFSNLVVRGGRYLTGTADAQNGESPLPFSSPDIAGVCRHRVMPGSFRWVVALLIAAIVLLLAWPALQQIVA